MLPELQNFQIRSYDSLETKIIAYDFDINPLAPEFRKNSFNPAGKLQLFRSVKLIETHGIMKITKKFTLYKIE